jgi:hypothetical protein
MADFLTRAAQRALGVAPVVKPVIASRYAPAGQTAGFSEEAVETVAPRPEPAAPPAVRPETERPSRVHRDPPNEPEVDTEPAPRELLPKTEALRHTPADPMPPRLVAERIIEPAAAPREIQTPPAEPADPRPPIAPETRMVAETPAGRAEARRAVPMGQHSPSPPIARLERREPAPATPPIRITIGRIDVRAVMPPGAPAPRNGTPAGRPALTLEEYTRQRKRGER